MEKNRMIFRSPPAPPPPSPIPTAKGSRSAADSILSDYIATSVQIPELTLPPRHAHRFKPDEIDYESLRSSERDSVSRLLRSVKECGVIRLRNHGISTEELRLALADGERIFGLTVECCSSYGDHERIVWRGDDRHIMEEATAAIGHRSYQVFRQKMENVSRQLEAIAQDLAKQFEEPNIQLGESTLNIYRYHRANIIDRISSAFGETRQDQSDPYALSLHLLLESTELFCVEPGWGTTLSFNTTPDTIVVTIGKELQEKSLGKFKSAQEKLMFKPFLHTNRPSFSIEQKWSISNMRKVVDDESNDVISLVDQILILMFIALLYKSFSYIFS